MKVARPAAVMVVVVVVVVVDELEVGSEDRPSLPLVLST